MNILVFADCNSSYCVLNDDMLLNLIDICLSQQSIVAFPLGIVLLQILTDSIKLNLCLRNHMHAVPCMQISAHICISIGGN